MDYLEEIKRFFEKNAGINKNKITLNSTMERDLGITGDDADEIMNKFFIEFKIDCSNFQSSLYFSDEGVDFLNITKLINLIFNHKKKNIIKSTYDIKIRDLINAIVLEKWGNPESI